MSLELLEMESDELAWLLLSGSVPERDAAREELDRRVAEAAEAERWRRAS